MLAPRGGVEASGRHFSSHGLGWCVERQQNAQRGLLALDHTTQTPNVGGMQLPGLDREDNLFRLPGVAIVEVDPPVDALVRALLAFSWSSTHQAERPPLELVRVGRGQRFGVLDRHRFSDHLVGLLDIVAVGVS